MFLTVLSNVWQVKLGNIYNNKHFNAVRLSTFFSSFMRTKLQMMTIKTLFA